MKIFLPIGFLLFFIPIKAQISIDSIWVSSNPICIDGNGSAIVQVSPSGNYTYQWTFGGTLTDPTNDTTGFAPTNTGNQTLIIEVSDGFGGYAMDSVIISVHGFVNFAASPSSIVAHCGEPVQLNTNISTSGQTVIAVGTTTGANTEYTYPAPFANWYANARQQYLFHASELTAMGIQAGDILGLNFPVNTIVGLITYPNYTVQMGHTTSNSLTATFLPVDPTILYQQNYTVQSGNNMILFDFPFAWNGTDNVVINICYTWVAQYNYTLNSISPWTTTSFSSSSWINSDGIVACPENLAYGTANYRPVTGFIFDQTTTASPIVYSWTPDSTLSANNVSDPIANTTADTWYHVTVTDSTCWAQDSVHVMIDSSYTFSMTQYPSQVCQGSTVNPILQQQWIDNWIWTIENNGISTSTNTTVSIQYDSVGVFGITLSGTTACGLSVEIIDSINVISNQPVIVLNNSADTFCINQPVTLNAIGSYGNVSWEYELNGVPQTQLGYFLSYTNSTVDSDTITINANFCNNSVDSTFIIYFVNCLGVEENIQEQFELIRSGTGFDLVFDNANDFEVELVDVSGKLIYKSSSDSASIHLSMQSQPAGIYLIRIITENDVYIRKVKW